VTALKKTRQSLGGIYGKILASRGHTRTKSTGRNMPSITPTAAAIPSGTMFTITPRHNGKESPDSSKFMFTNLQDYFNSQREKTGSTNP